MGLKFDGFGHRGTKEELVMFSVTSDCNLSHYMVIDTTYDEQDKVSDLHPHLFHFPSRVVAGGDTVFLYSGVVVEEEIEPELVIDEDGGEKYNHVFHWGAANNIWNKTGDVGRLVWIGGGETFIVPPHD